MSQEIPNNNFDGLQVNNEDMEQLELSTTTEHSDIQELPSQHHYQLRLQKRKQPRHDMDQEGQILLVCRQLQPQTH